MRQGLLAPVLADCVDLQPSPIHAITLTRRHRLPKIQACIDHWAQWFSAAEPSAERVRAVFFLRVFRTAPWVNST